MFIWGSVTWVLAPQAGEIARARTPPAFAALDHIHRVSTKYGYFEGCLSMFRTCLEGLVLSSLIMLQVPAGISLRKCTRCFKSKSFMA
jgi:hypothetical protein